MKHKIRSFAFVPAAPAAGRAKQRHGAPAPQLALGLANNCVEVVQVRLLCSRVGAVLGCAMGVRAPRSSPCYMGPLHCTPPHHNTRRSMLLARPRPPPTPRSSALTAAGTAVTCVHAPCQQTAHCSPPHPTRHSR